MLDFDTTRLPADEGEWADLVGALTRTDDYSETHYLEMKSELDMRNNADFFKIPKFILGAANRMPDDAAPYFSGHALMVLGVKEGSAAGILKPLETKDMRAKIEQYTGHSKIGWEAHYLPGEEDPDRRVVIIVVAPPQWGDPIRVCHQRFTERVPTTKKGPCSNGKCPNPAEKDLVHAENGSIFCRPDSETRLARAKEVEQLMDRAMHHRAADPNVIIHGAAIRPVFDFEVLDAYVGAYRESYQSALAARPDLIAAFSPMFKLDPRSRDEFMGEVNAWVEEVDDKWSSLLPLAAVIGQDEHELSFSVTNGNGVPLKRPDLRVTIPGTTFAAVGVDEERFDVFRILPKPPRQFGEPPNPAAHWNNPLPTILPMTRVRPRKRFDQIDYEYKKEPEGLTISVQMEDLRAFGTHVVPGDDVFVLTYQTDATELAAAWEITAADHSRPPYTGTARIPIVDVDVTAVIGNQLREAIESIED